MSFVLFAFLLLFECIKPFGIGLFARTAPALAHLLVLLLLELQRLLRFGADADLARSAVRLLAVPVWDCGVQALRQSQQPD